MSAPSTHDGSDGGYDEWLDSVAAGEGFYLACPEGHGSLPPRRFCPHCGSPDLRETPLSAAGEIETYTLVHVAAPRFADDVPYVTAIAAFGPVRLTGMLRGADPAAIETGATVAAGVETSTTGDRVLVFRPRRATSSPRRSVRNDRF